MAGAVWVGHYGWVLAGDVVMPAWGWLMMGLGIFFTLLVGGGLMALVFSEPCRSDGCLHPKTTATSQVGEKNTEAQETAFVIVPRQDVNRSALAV